MFEEPARALFARRCEEGFGRRFLDDLAGVHEDDAVRGGPGEAHLMRDDEHRHALAGEVGHDIEYFLDHFGIEGARRFVEKHDFGVHGEGASDGHALLLPAGKLLGPGYFLVGEADFREELSSEGDSFLLAFLEHDRGRKRDVVDHVQVGKEIEALENHAHFLADVADIGLFVGDALSIDQNRARVEAFEAVHRAQEGAFARTRGADDQDDFAFLDAEVDAAKGLDGAVEGFHGAFYLNVRFHDASAFLPSSRQGARKRASSRDR